MRLRLFLARSKTGRISQLIGLVCVAIFTIMLRIVPLPFLPPAPSEITGPWALLLLLAIVGLFVSGVVGIVAEVAWYVRRL